MSKKGTKALASATLMSLVLTTALSAGPVKAAVAGEVTRTSGADRFATAAQVATKNWSSSDNVVLVNGDNYPDAVSATVLAKTINAPILLTSADSLNTDTKNALNTLKPKNIYVIGGNASVSSAVRADLTTANYTLTELGGANRFETNVAVAKELVAHHGVKADKVILVNGDLGFSDALAAAPVAAAKGEILLLGSNNASAMSSVVDFVKANSSAVTVIGTKSSISDDIMAKLGTTDRVDGGATRFATNLNILKTFAKDLKTDKLYVANASGNGYADALVASAVAGKYGAPLVLVDGQDTEATTNAIAYIKATATKDTDLNAVGGTGVVSDTTLAAIKTAVVPTVPVFTGTITSVEAVENQFVNAKATGETLEFTVNGGQKVTAQEVVDQGYSIKIKSESTADVFETSTTDANGLYVSKDGILDKDKLITFLAGTQNKDFKYSVEIDKNDEVVGQTDNVTVTVINGDATATALNDITVKQGVTGSTTTKVTSGKLVKGETVTVTKVTGSIGSASGVTVTNKKFYTSDPFVATVDETSGEITAVNPGTFTLTVKSGSSSKDYSFTVSSDTSRKVSSTTASTSSVKIGKTAATSIVLTLKDQFGDLIDPSSVVTAAGSTATTDSEIQLNADIKSGTTVIANTTYTNTDATDGQVTAIVTGTTDAGTGSLKVYNKNGVMLSIPVTVVADTAISSIKLEAASDDANSKDLALDLDPKAADDNGDAYVKLSLNKYGTNGTYLGKFTSGVTITATTDSNKTILDGGSPATITPDADGNFVIAIPSADPTDYDLNGGTAVSLLDNGIANNVYKGTITVKATYNNMSSTITLNVKDTTPSVSGSLNSAVSTQFGTVNLSDVIDATKLTAGGSQGDGKVRIAQDGTVFMKADASKNNGSGIQDIDDSTVSYDKVYDITLGRVKVTAKSGDVDTSAITISGGTFTINKKAGAGTIASGYIRIGIQRVHEDTPFTTVDVKVADN